MYELTLQSKSHPLGSVSICDNSAFVAWTRIRMEDEQGKALSFLGTSCQVMAVWPRKVEDEMSTRHRFAVPRFPPSQHRLTEYRRVRGRRD